MWYRVVFIFALCILWVAVSFSAFRVRCYKNTCTKRFILREIRALQILKSNYRCICGRNAYHFPEIIQGDQNKKLVQLKFCGENLQHPYLPPTDTAEQVQCIHYNLTKSKIFHMDISKKNICIDNDGVIFLIDFDMCVFQNEPDPTQSDKINRNYTIKMIHQYIQRNNENELILRQILN